MLLVLSQSLFSTRWILIDLTAGIMTESFSKPTPRMRSETPDSASFVTDRCSKGTPSEEAIMHLGILSVYGLSLVPRPAARTIAALLIHLTPVPQIFVRPGGRVLNSCAAPPCLPTGTKKWKECHPSCCV